MEKKLEQVCQLKDTLGVEMKMTKDILKMTNEGLNTARAALEIEKNEVSLLKYNQEYMKNKLDEVENEVRTCTN